MEKEVLILAGGLGTRLKNIISDIPKPMAPVNNKPFLEYILTYLSKKNIKKVIISVGYKKDVIINYFGYKYRDIEIKYAVENEPLGTGGAVVNALNIITGSEFFILNGDTYFEFNPEYMIDTMKQKEADLVVAIKKVNNCHRYGGVIIDEDLRIVNFTEKGVNTDGLINAGVYYIKKSVLQSIKFPDKFSFEKYFLEKYYRKLRFYGKEFDSYFIDIGIPEDYLKASKHLNNH